MSLKKAHLCRMHQAASLTIVRQTPNTVLNTVGLSITNRAGQDQVSSLLTQCPFPALTVLSHSLS